MPASVYAIGTMDTKGEELDFVAVELRSANVAVLTVDVGTAGPPIGTPGISRETVADFHPQGAPFVLGQTDRGVAVAAMAEALQRFLLAEVAKGLVSGVIGIGGSGGTALITTALRALPIGMPKVMVSTVASGNVAPYVGCSDICMLYSVVDVAGINEVSQRVLANAAHAIAGMAKQPTTKRATKPAIGMTMFGVTTPCVTAVRQALEQAGFDALVFHATGSGGQAMEKLIESDMIVGALDITTTEVADEVVGGVFAAGPKRFDVILQKGIPYLLSLGALDMVNFGAADTVPAMFRDRLFHVHNPQVTLMRTTPDENRACARWIANKLQQAASPVTIFIPEKGVSALDAPGQPFHNPEANTALFDELIKGVADNKQVTVVRLPLHINDPKFAEAMVQRFLTGWKEPGR